MQKISETKEQPYFEGRSLPLNDLSPAEFENFVAAALSCIGEAEGIEIQGMPSGSGDGGFDLSGRDLRTGRIVCIQCKRQFKPIGIAQVAIELAKVAANSKIEGSDVGQHRFICTGGRTKELITLLRGDFRKRLALDASNAFVNARKGELVSLREKIVECGDDPLLTVKSYVESLDDLIVWDQNGFDVALSSRWEDVLQVIGRFFKVATVVREFPRASFDRAAYIHDYDNFSTAVEPRFKKTPLPSGISVKKSLNTDSEIRKEVQIENLLDLAELEDGSLVLMYGEGGVGKTTTLELIRAKVLQVYPDTSLAIYISLANYVPDGLNNLIHRELGVDFGVWHSLPDRIVLLCDGLNECPSEYVQNFLNELKSILKRRLAACILTTRETSRHRSVVLPYAPNACSRVEQLTPSAVSRIAKQSLEPEHAKAFEIAFLALVNRAQSLHLWTPFSVGVGLECWRLDAALPVTLGEMIEKVIYSRCEKDAEIPTQRIGPNIVLKLAGALAFNALINQGQLGCNEDKASRWIRNAKSLCSDALGVFDMTDLDVIELLKHHDLLYLSSTGYFSFGHQLLVGALAAPMLALDWRAHIPSANNSVSDDAWIFAARHIPRSDMKEFLEKMFHVDLILGARVACELPIDFHSDAEYFIFQSIENNSSEILRLHGIVALSVLATKTAIARLKELSKGTTSEIAHRAKCAIAATGDSHFLRRLLPEVEAMRAFPGTMSGGDIDIWESAPYSARLEVARNWLSTCKPGCKVIESISLIAHEQNPSDSVLIERQFVEGMDWNQWRYVLYALNRILSERAVEIFNENLTEAKQPEHKAMLFQIAASIGIPYDLKLAFDCAISDLTEVQPESMVEHELFKLIENVISKVTLSSEMTDIVEHELKLNDTAKIGRLWTIAGLVESATIAKIAETRLALWGDDLGYVCNYFLSQPQLQVSRREQILEICEAGLQKEKFWYSWCSGRALELAVAVGLTPKIIISLDAMVAQLTRIRIASEVGQTDFLSPNDLYIVNLESSEYLESRLDRYAGQLARTCLKAKHLISNETKLDLLYFDHTVWSDFDTLYQLVSGIDQNDIDQVLEKIANVDARFSSLCIACEYGLTTLRMQLLSEELTKWIHSPMNLKFLTKAIDTCWCNDILNIVVGTVAETDFDWNASVIWEFVAAIGKKIEASNKDQIDAALLSASNDTSKQILEFWRDKAVGGRFGLSRLAIG